MNIALKGAFIAGVFTNIHASAVASGYGASAMPIPKPYVEEELRPPIYKDLGADFDKGIRSCLTEVNQISRHSYTLKDEHFRGIDVLPAFEFLRTSFVSVLEEKMFFLHPDDAIKLSTLLPLRVRSALAFIYKFGLVGIRKNLPLSHFLVQSSQYYVWDDVMCHAEDPSEMLPYLLGYLDNPVGMGGSVPIWKVIEQCNHIVDKNIRYVLLNRAIAEIVKINRLEGKAMLGALYAGLLFEHESFKCEKELGLRLLEEGVISGSAAAQYYLAMAYEDSKLGLGLQYPGAAYIYHSYAAGQGYPPALNHLANAHIYGKLGLKKTNPKITIEYYRRAFEQRHAEAVYNLAVIYKLGVPNLPMDIGKARILFKLASELGNSLAQYALGGANERGELDLPINLPEAIRLYNLSAASGSLKAIEDLSRLGIIV